MCCTALLQDEQHRRQVAAARVHLQGCISRCRRDRDTVALEKVIAELEKHPNSLLCSQPRGSVSMSSDVEHLVQQECEDLIEDARLLISEIRRNDAQTAVLNRLAALVSTAAALTEAGPPQALGNEDDVATQRQIDLVLQDIQEGLRDAETVELDSSLPVRICALSMQLASCLRGVLV